MQYDILTNDDIEKIRDLQPEGWSDITKEFKYYIDSDFCNPIKIVIDNKIIGVGAYIMFENTVWLAHIIVHKDYRKKGYGFQIVEILLKNIRDKSIDSVLLIATEVGEPLYEKAGFRGISDYIHLKREQLWKNSSVSKNIVPYDNSYFSDILRLDKEISGENRESLIKNHLQKAFIYLNKKTLTGFYLPDLGEGLIFADNPEAGIELMKAKYSKVDKAVIPSENREGIYFLKNNGFIESATKGKRMIIGKDIAWKPECFFSRIGGNYG